MKKNETSGKKKGRKYLRFMPNSPHRFSRPYFGASREEDKRLHIKESHTISQAVLIAKICERRYKQGYPQFTTKNVTSVINEYFDQIHLEMMRGNSVALRRIGHLRFVMFLDRPRTALEKKSGSKYTVRGIHTFVPSPGAFHNFNNKMSDYLAPGGVDSYAELVERLDRYISATPPPIQTLADLKKAMKLERLAEENPDLAFRFHAARHEASKDQRKRDARNKILEVKYHPNQRQVVELRQRTMMPDAEGNQEQMDNSFDYDLPDE